MTDTKLPVSWTNKRLYVLYMRASSDGKFMPFVGLAADSDGDALLVDEAPAIDDNCAGWICYDVPHFLLLDAEGNPVQEILISGDINNWDYVSASFSEDVVFDKSRLVRDLPDIARQILANMAQNGTEIVVLNLFNTGQGMAVKSLALDKDTLVVVPTPPLVAAHTAPLNQGTGPAAPEKGVSGYDDDGDGDDDDKS